jgi:hypothetical protein
MQLSDTASIDPAWVAINLVLLAEQLSCRQQATGAARFAATLQLASEIAADDRCECGYVTVRVDGHTVCGQCGALELHA